MNLNDYKGLMDLNNSINDERIKAEDFIAFIEIEQGSKNKYELDKQTGLIILDRILYTSTHYPMNYGFLPRTFCDDGDPLDVFVLCSQPIEKMSLVRCYPIGVVKMTDGDKNDDKIIAIPFGDPQYNGYSDIEELPYHIFEELKHFLGVYKQLENKKVEVKQISGAEEAKNVIVAAKELYKKTFVKN